MDQMLIDATRVWDAVVSDEVVLIGQQGEREITAGDLAGWCGTIPWEILTNINYRVPRLYLGQQAA
jgi:alanine racemase